MRETCQRRKARWNSEQGAGSVLALAVIGATMTVTMLTVTLFAAFAVAQSVQNAADAAALAAADTASGAVSGYPCETAGEAARQNGAALTGCTVDGLIATITVQRGFLGFELSSRARAGPPP